MKRAYEYRESAWNILRGRYWWTVLAGLIAAILGGFGSSGSFHLDFNLKGDSNGFYHFAQRLLQGQLDLTQLREIVRPFAGIANALGGLFVAYGIAMFIVGSAVELGYNRFNLSLYESSDAPKIETLFSRFSYFGNAFSLRLLMLVKTLLWALLFIIPGIIAAYRYAMAPYIMAENPDMSASSAIGESKYLMSNNKWRLFCLQFSFIGWYILAMFTAGIGGIFLAPYVKAAYTAFYLDLMNKLPASPYRSPTAPVSPGATVPSAQHKAGEGESNEKELI